MNIARDTTLSTSQAAIKFVDNQGRLIAKSLGLQEKKYDGTFSIRIYRDIILESTYLKKLPASFRKDFSDRFYTATLNRLNEIDNTIKLGYITLDTWRISKMLQGQWDEPLPSLYAKAVLCEQMDDKELSFFFSNRKLIYSGVALHGSNTYQLFHTFIQLPLIPYMIRDTKLGILNTNMIKEGIDYTIFEGCILKPGQPIEVSSIEDIESELNVNYHNPFNEFTLFSRNLAETIIW